MPDDRESPDTAEPAKVVGRRGAGSHAAKGALVMEDVARAAGVSPMTVSRVLNDHPAVKPETRKKVLATVAMLDYRRNSAARALATHRSETIGVVALDMIFYGQAACVRGIEHAARAAGYFVSIATLKTVNERSIPRGLRLAHRPVGRRPRRHHAAGLGPKGAARTGGRRADGRCGWFAE